jgi:diacylglycerol kinase (ATP)
MGRPIVIIANSRAGARPLVRAGRVLDEAGLEYRVVPTTGPGHATDVAREALAGGARFLVAAGGDGTVHEVLNGMMTGDSEDAVLGVLPMGSGCDFVRTFGIPRNVTAAARRLPGDGFRDIDVGKVTCEDGQARYFANIAEAGLGGAVVATAARMRGLPGSVRYFAAFWLTLPAVRHSMVRITPDDGPAFSALAINVVAANCRYYGGGMRISPKSDPADGFLDLLTMTGPKRVSFTTLPAIYAGRHLPHRHIAEHRARRIRIEADPPLRIEADGEVLGMTPATFEVVPKALRLRI